MEEIFVEGEQDSCCFVYSYFSWRATTLNQILVCSKVEILSMIGNDMVAVIIIQLEPFSMAIRMRGIAGLLVATSHNTDVFEEKDTERQKKRKIGDKNKNRR